MGKTPAASWRETVSAEMDSWIGHPDGWFGGARNRPADFTRGLAMTALTRHGFGGPTPDVRPTEGGGIVFEWGIGVERAEMEVYPNGEIVITNLNDPSDFIEVERDSKELEDFLAAIERLPDL